MTDSEFAPAKVNLYLHVGPVQPDGYHPLESWMVFADVGDRVALAVDKTMAFAATGPFSADVPHDESNLVLRARDAFLAAAAVASAPFRLTLDKQLPPASGIGGGSSDAAATLRLLHRRTPLADEALQALALALGADVPACLRARGTLARGRGEQLSSAPKAPPLPAVLVNPRVGVSTGKIFGLFDRHPPVQLAAAGLPPMLTTPADVARALEATRNDLAAPALAHEPVIGDVLAVLNAAPQTLLARMSGSGATCFALCHTVEDAQTLADRIAQDNPGWWIGACTLL